MAESNVTNQLPPEVLVKIFEHCDLTELVNIVDVCQLWRDIVIHQHMSVNDLVIRRPDDINKLVSLLCKALSFTKLRIVWDVPRNMDCRSVSLGALANATSLNHLQSFMFGVQDACQYNYYRVLDALLMLLQQSSRDTLTHLKIIDTAWDYTIHTTVMGLLEACQQLSHLIFNDCDMEDDADKQRFEDIISTLTHLELLDLRDTNLVSDNLSFIAAIKRGCPNISNNILVETLNVHPNDVITSEVGMLQFVSHVVTLEITNINTELLTALIGCFNESASQLTVYCLCIERYTGYGTADGIMHYHHVTDDMLLPLAQHLCGLEIILVRYQPQLTNQGVVNVITSSPQLERIDICGIKNIDTDIIQLLDRVFTKKNVRINAYDTKLSDEMRNSPDRELYTGKNRNICLEYRSRW